MSDFLSNLVARTIAQPALRPRTRSRFEAPAIEEAPLIWPEATREADAQDMARAEPAVRASTPVRVAGPAHQEARSLPSGETPLGQPAGRRRSTEADRPAAAVEEVAREVAAAGEVERVVETNERVIHVPVAARPHRFDEEPPRIIERRGPREVEEVQRERVIHTTTDRTRRAIDRPRHSVAATPAAEPVIQVSIGRIEVRAVPSAPPAARNAPRSGTMTIDDYVAKRKAKERR